MMMWNFTLYSQTTGMVLPFYERPTLPSSKGFPYLPASKLKKVGKTTRSFRYDLSQIPCNYIVEVRNRFKGLDLIDRVPDELWMEVHDIVQETGIKTIPKKKKSKIAKWLSEEALQIAVKEEKGKSKEKRKAIPI